MTDKQMVPFRMAPEGLAWLEGVASRLEISRSDAIRMSLQYAKECDGDGRFSRYLQRAVDQGRITRVKPKKEKAGG